MVDILNKAIKLLFYEFHPRLTTGKILAALNTLILVYVSQYLFLEQRIDIWYYVSFVLLPMSLSIYLCWHNLYILSFTFLIIFYYITIIANTSLTFGHSARYNTTKSNLSTLKFYLRLYRARNSKFPNPTVSGGAYTTQQNKLTLEAVFNNPNGNGVESEYIGGEIPGELLSDTQGNNFVCIVNTLKEFKADQSHLKNCLNFNVNTHIGSTGGGYLYYPKDDLLRLNFKVNQNNYQIDKQKNIGQLFSEWAQWSAKNSELTTDYPVRW